MSKVGTTCPIANNPIVLCVYILTWNVGSFTPGTISLDKALSLDGKSSCPKEEPDIFVIGLQEVSASFPKQIRGIFMDHEWSNKLNEYLEQYNYKKVRSSLMQGLLINVFAKPEHIPNIRNIETQKTGTGVGGFWGNKGAVSVRMNLYNASVTFVNMHLAAHDGKVQDRIQQFSQILSKHNYKALHYIFDHDIVSIFGDLNFRVEGFDKSETIVNKIKRKNIYELLERDELRSLLQNNELFRCLNEMCPSFSPTFKFTVGTHSYNRKRRPAWCDRILYRALDKHARCTGFPMSTGIILRVKQLSYRSHPSYVQSDHKPVSAEFTYKIGYSRQIIDPKAGGDYSRKSEEL